MKFVIYQNIHIREETHCRLSYQIYGFNKQSTDNQHAIFLLKKNINREIIRAIMAYLLT